jgi:hypothetical protein
LKRFAEVIQRKQIILNIVQLSCDAKKEAEPKTPKEGYSPDTGTAKDGCETFCTTYVDRRGEMVGWNQTTNATL